eukprot:6191878-Pleurochrysis_carterae.AAC.2
MSFLISILVYYDFCCFLNVYKFKASIKAGRRPGRCASMSAVTLPVQDAACPCRLSLAEAG